MTKRSAKIRAKVHAHADIKEQEHSTAIDLSADLNEAVEKSIVKCSTDEAMSSPR